MLLVRPSVSPFGVVREDRSKEADVEIWGEMLLWL